LFPDGSIDLLFNLEPAGRGRHGEVTEPAAAVMGVLTGPVDVVRPAHASLFGVVLAPGAARRVLGVPAHELRDRLANLADPMGRRSARLLDELRAAPSTAARVEAADRFLLRTPARVPPAELTAALLLIRRCEGRRRIAAIRRELGLSERRLERLFREHV